MKKRIYTGICLILLFSLMASLAVAYGTEIQPRLTGIITMTSSLTISSKGAAKCDGTVVLKSGYSADITVKLQQDGTTIKTWTNSGSGTVSAGGTYYVMSGHNYIVVTSAIVYDSNDKVVALDHEESQEKYY